MSALDDELEKYDDTLTAGWREVEDFLANLHELARESTVSSDFYQQLLKGCARTLAALGGVVWQTDLLGKWQPIASVNLEAIPTADRSTHMRIVQQAAEPRVLIAATHAESVILIAAVHTEDGSRFRTVIEFSMRPGTSPATQQGWEEFLAAVIHAAQEFELRQELRFLRGEQANQADILGLLRRIHSGSTLEEVAFCVVNEGSRFLGVDRLSLIMQCRGQWRLIAASGVESLETRADAVKDMETLAQSTAHWGEPLEYAEDLETNDLPTKIAESLGQHIDHSHARRLVAVPVDWQSRGDAKSASAVLIAENFGKSHGITRHAITQFAELCEPALKQVLEWDRWPIRPVVNWTNRTSRLWHEWGVTRVGVISACIALALLSLALVSTDFEIEASATLMPRVVQDVFATTSGTVREIRVAHGEQVRKGDVLGLLDDPQLDLDMERVQGELAMVQKRLEAIAVARTDRQAREELSPDRLPLSAESKQLELRHASLLQQSAILTKQRESLTLRSPIDGMLLTLDVQNLLRGRPVERGQILFTVADTASAWQLETRVPQDRIGYVVMASKSNNGPLPVRFRLAGDRGNIYTGHIMRIAETALHDTAKLGEELPDVRVDVAVDKEMLPAARPEMKAVVRINCGRRPLAYVWLHDVWDNIYSWLAF